MNFFTCFKSVDTLHVIKNEHQTRASYVPKVYTKYLRRSLSVSLSLSLYLSLSLCQQVAWLGKKITVYQSCRCEVCAVRGGRCAAGWLPVRCTVRGLFAMQCAARGLVAFARCAARSLRCAALRGRCDAMCASWLQLQARRAGCSCRRRRCHAFNHGFVGGYHVLN